MQGHAVARAYFLRDGPMKRSERLIYASLLLSVMGIDGIKYGEQVMEGTIDGYKPT